MSLQTTKPPVHLRPFVEADLPILRGWFTDPTVSGRVSAPTETWRAHIQSEHVQCFTITDRDGQMVGFIQVDDEANGDAWCDMVVAPERQVQGIGHAALSLLVRTYQRTGHQLCASVEPDNLASLRCLSRTGFVKDDQPDSDGLLIYRRKPAP